MCRPIAHAFAINRHIARHSCRMFIHRPRRRPSRGPGLEGRTQQQPRTWGIHFGDRLQIGDRPPARYQARHQRQRHGARARRSKTDQTLQTFRPSHRGFIRDGAVCGHKAFVMAISALRTFWFLRSIGFTWSGKALIALPSCRVCLRTLSIFVRSRNRLQIVRIRPEQVQSDCAGSSRWFRVHLHRSKNRINRPAQGFAHRDHAVAKNP